MNNSLAFSSFTTLCSCHLGVVPTHFHHPEKKRLVPIERSAHLPPSPGRLVTTTLPCVSMSLPVLDISYSIRPFEFVYFHSYVLEAHSRGSRYHLGGSSVLFQHMVIAHLFICSSSDGHLSRFCLLALVSSAAVKIHIPVFVFLLLILVLFSSYLSDLSTALLLAGLL